MNKQLIKNLCNADSIASNEDEVRKILFQEMKEYCDEVYCDAIGSIILHKKSKNPQALKIMFCAHMDEVGFMVRHISDIGFIHLMMVGGVIDKAKEMQLVRITTSSGTKREGLLNVTRDSDGKIKDLYVDVGCDNKDQVIELGIEIGNMVCFASETKQLTNSVFIGKAMDDRAGCYVMIEACREMAKDPQNDIYFVGTSSEEVGIRGGKTATELIQPDIIFALDVANNPELVKNYTNHRIIGKGPMIVHYDKTMSPNIKLLKYIKDIANQNNIAYQEDMLSGGGTDAGNAHLVNGGRLALVLGIPLRYCHGNYSMVHSDDLDALKRIVNIIIDQVTQEDYKKFIDYIGDYRI